MMSKYASAKIRLISFFAMWAVVSWHVGADGGTLKRYLCPLLCFWSVPWFFFASGVFFVYSIQKRTWFQFLVCKLRSLLIPYVIWCLVGAGYKALVSENISFDVCSIFALDRLHPIGDGPMWYIRALMIIFTISIPIWKLTESYLKKQLTQRFFFAALVILALNVSRFIGVDLHFGPGSSVVYFLVGVAMSGTVTKFPMITDKRSKIMVGCVLMIVALGVRSAWFGMGYDYYRMGGSLIANASVVFFIAALLVLSDFGTVVEWLHKFFGRVAEYNTFVYMVHNIVLWHIVAIVLSSGWSPDVVYVIFSLTAPFLFIGIGSVVRGAFPRVYSVIIGNRG